MSAIDFAEFVKEQTQKSATQKIDWDLEVKEWLESLDGFYNAVESYLLEYRKEGAIAIDYEDKTIREEGIAPYTAKAASITIGATKVDLVPVGTNLIGAKGRVDLFGPNGRVRFVLVGQDTVTPKVVSRILSEGETAGTETSLHNPQKLAWKIATPPPSIHYIPLSQDEFFEALMEVANG